MSWRDLKFPSIPPPPAAPAEPLQKTVPTQPTSTTPQIMLPRSSIEAYGFGAVTLLEGILPISYWLVKEILVIILASITFDFIRQVPLPFPVFLQKANKYCTASILAVLVLVAGSFTVSKQKDAQYQIDKQGEQITKQGKQIEDAEKTANQQLCNVAEAEAHSLHTKTLVFQRDLIHDGFNAFLSVKPKKTDKKLSDIPTHDMWSEWPPFKALMGAEKDVVSRSIQKFGQEDAQPIQDIEAQLLARLHRPQSPRSNVRLYLDAEMAGTVIDPASALEDMADELNSLSQQLCPKPTTPPQ